MRDLLGEHHCGTLLENTVVFDLETTGLSPHHDDIIQVAAVRIVNGRIRRRDSFLSYAATDRSLSPRIVQLTGIKDEDLEDAPELPDVLREFSSYCEASTLVAHNGHRFDISFIERACKRHKMSTRPASYFDSISLSKAVWRGGRRVSHRLDRVICRLGVEKKGLRRHDARADVILLAECLVGMRARLRSERREEAVPVFECRLPRRHRG